MLAAGVVLFASAVVARLGGPQVAVAFDRHRNIAQSAGLAVVFVGLMWAAGWSS